jgi:succinate dehydrogenase hydrophobic anchor subunit
MPNTLPVQIVARTTVAALALIVLSTAKLYTRLHFTFPTVGSKEISDNFMEEWRNTFLANPYLNVFDWLMALEAEKQTREYYRG